MRFNSLFDHKYLPVINRYLKALALVVAMTLIFVVQNEAFNHWLGLYWGPYELRFFFVTLSLGLILYSPALFFRGLGKYIYLLIVSTAVSFLLIAQFLYFTYSQSFLQVTALKYIGLAPSESGTIAILLSPQLLLFLVAPLLVLICLALSFRKKYIEILLSKKEKLVIFALILLVIAWGYYFVIREEREEYGNASQLYSDTYDLNGLVERIGIVNFSLEDIVRYVLDTNEVTPSDMAFLKTFAESQTPPPTGGKDFGIAKGKNLIIIQVESLENCLINTTIDGQAITPNLNALAKQGLYFSNYYTQIGPGNTADAEFSTLNSLYPLPDDVAFVSYAQNIYHALPETLVENGYSTYALHGDVPNFWNRSSIYPNLGYETQFSISDYVITRQVGYGPSPLGDQDFLSQSLPKMEQFKQPFMATLITLSSHTPFILPQDLQTLTIPTSTNLNFTQQQYLESIHYADNAIGQFIAGLKKDGLYNNSLIVIYGDHESFTNIDEALGTSKNYLPGLADSEVPLIIIDPGSNLVGQMTTPGSHIDLFPTIANLLGVKPPAGILGRDLLNNPDPVVVHRNVYSGTINTILTSNMAFEANSDGNFEDGTCLEMPSKDAIPISSCQALYTLESNTVRASDIIIEGNLLNFYVDNLGK